MRIRLATEPWDRVWENHALQQAGEDGSENSGTNLTSLTRFGRLSAAFAVNLSKTFECLPGMYSTEEEALGDKCGSLAFPVTIFEPRVFQGKVRVVTSKEWQLPARQRHQTRRNQTRRNWPVLRTRTALVGLHIRVLGLSCMVLVVVVLVRVLVLVGIGIGVVDSWEVQKWKIMVSSVSACAGIWCLWCLRFAPAADMKGAVSLFQDKPEVEEEEDLRWHGT